jgi:hypothetical protein
VNCHESNDVDCHDVTHVDCRGLIVAHCHEPNGCDFYEWIDYDFCVSDCDSCEATDCDFFCDLAVNFSTDFFWTDYVNVIVNHCVHVVLSASLPRA